MKQEALISLVAILLVSGCLGSTQSDEKVECAIQEEVPSSGTPLQAAQSCIELCQQVKSTQNLSSGPCLSDNNPNWTVSNWVCDVAHCPRTEVDNQPDNQCQEFRGEEATNFVEVTPDCEFIRTG